MAKGGSDTHTPLPRASAATPPSAASPNETRWGCGTHRYYDPQTQKCRGPWDFWKSLSQFSGQLYFVWPQKQCRFMVLIIWWRNFTIWPTSPENQNCSHEATQVHLTWTPCPKRDQALEILVAFMRPFRCASDRKL